MPLQCSPGIVSARPRVAAGNPTKESTMTHDILSTRTRFDEIRACRHGELPLPEWIPPHMIGDIELNGTFEVSTDHGHVRVHSGNTVIERQGTVWVCPTDEAPGTSRASSKPRVPLLTMSAPIKPVSLERQRALSTREKAQDHHGTATSALSRPYRLPAFNRVDSYQPALDRQHLPKVHRQQRLPALDREHRG